MRPRSRRFAPRPRSGEYLRDNDASRDAYPTTKDKRRGGPVELVGTSPFRDWPLDKVVFVVRNLMSKLNGHPG